MTVATDDITCVCRTVPVCPQCGTYGYLSLVITHEARNILTVIDGGRLEYWDTPAVEVEREVYCAKCNYSTTEDEILKAAQDWADRENRRGGTCMVPERAVSDCGGAA